MNYSRPRYLWIPSYQLSSCGKHGDRYKEDGGAVFPILRFQIETCKITQTDFSRISMMSEYLEIPLTHVQSETEQDKVYIDVVSATAIESKI